jgi:hypothetical protein
MPTASSISIKVNGVDITDKVVFNETSFQSQANPIQGSFKVVVRDTDQTFSASVGSKVTCHIDGVGLAGGYVMRLGRGNFLPAVSTSPPSSVKSRKWILEGPDFNVLFDKRIVYDAANPYASPAVPAGSRTITKAFNYMMNNLLDVPPGLGWSTHVDTIYDDDGSQTAYGTEENGGLYVGTAETWRKQMDDFADQSGIIYYIDADFEVHLHAYENVLAPFIITDVANQNALQFREGEYTKDFTRIVTEAHVWGGSSIRSEDGGPGGDVVYAKYPDPPAGNAREQGAIDRLAQYGLWQMGEERAGQNNYLLQSSVNKRARVIINGPTGIPPTNGIEGGFSRPYERFTCTWYAHDVPGQNHVRPGELQDIILYTQNVVSRLPLRSMRISFPSKPDDANMTYVMFAGEFGTAYSDSRHLWRWLRRNRPSKGVATVLVNNSSTSVPPGSMATAWPAESADGARVVFTFPFTFYQNQFDLFLNGLFQRPQTDYTYDSVAKQVTFTVAPGVGDGIWATGYVSQ